MNIFTIPAHRPFLQTLAEGLLEQAGGDSEQLARMRVLLPTRRACRMLRDMFLGISAGDALLLPRMQAIGDVDTDELDILAGELEPDVPSAISPLHRRLQLARLIRAAPVFAGTAPQAVALADTLGRLLDHIQNEGLDLSVLDGLVPVDYAQHWQLTLDFLSIIREYWPVFLQENNLMDPAARRHALLVKLAQHWTDTPPEGPVIAAGSTGSIPGTAALLRAVARLPQGQVVLPGFDTGMDADAWRAIDETHPQATMKNLLAYMECAPDDVRPWRDDRSVSPRTALWREVMRPADTLGRWLRLNESEQSDIRESLSAIRMVECRTELQEARAIALLVRETINHPGKTVCIVTGDRTLARRIRRACLRTGIVVDDSGGDDLADSPKVEFIMALARMWCGPRSRIDFLDLIKHPFMGWQDNSLPVRIEKADIRGRMGLFDPAGILEHAVSSAGDAEDRTRAQRLAEFLRSDTPEQLGDYIRMLCAAAESLAACPLWDDEDGHALANLFVTAQRDGAILGALERAEFLDILAQMIAAASIRRNIEYHPRVRLFGRLESRMVSADRVIMAGFNEGQWPPDAPADPWFSRAMRTRAGLPSPQRSQGLSAHDCVQAGSATEVFLTRALRVAGAPTQPGRWFERMGALARCVGIAPESLHARSYVRMAARLDNDNVETVPAARPAPRIRPGMARARASISAIQRFRCDPYGYYAASILRLPEEKPINQKFDAILKGQFWHDVLKEFTDAYPDALPGDAAACLHGIAARHAQALALGGADKTLFESEMEKIVQLIVAQETMHRADHRVLHTEWEATHNFDHPRGSFTLNARFDRVDLNTASSDVEIIDYKTGKIPGVNDVRVGLFPQLPLEAVLWAHISDRPVEKLTYWPVKRRPEKLFHVMTGTDKFSAADAAAQAEERLMADINALLDPDTAYPSLPDPQAARKYPGAATYRHLARADEWSVDDMEGEEGDRDDD